MITLLFQTVLRIWILHGSFVWYLQDEQEVRFYNRRIKMNLDFEYDEPLDRPVVGTKIGNAAVTIQLRKIDENDE